MRKNIHKKVGDAERSAGSGVRSVSEFGTPAGHEERLYRTGEGNYFFYGVGGYASFYPKAKLSPLSREDAENWAGEFVGNPAQDDFPENILEAKPKPHRKP